MLASPRQRRVLALALIAIATLIVWYVNQIAPHLRDYTLDWNQVYLFPLIRPLGADFRTGLYIPGSFLLAGKDPYAAPFLWYPPFSVLLFLPYHILDLPQAYSIHVFALVLLTVGSVWCSIRIAEPTILKGTSSHGTGDSGIATPLFLSLSFLTVSSYGFIFSVERGNFDIYALALSLAGLWILVRNPDRLWLQVICFSAAAHLKVYPAVLFLLLFWRHGGRSLVPIVVVNAALLFCIGPGPALHFIERLLEVAASTPWIYVANHSAVSFGGMLNDFLRERWGVGVPGIVLVGLPVVIWVAAALVLFRRGNGKSSVLWLFAVSVPLMNVVPSTSHDYKLILLSTPFAVLLEFLLEDYVASGRRLPLAQIAIACALLVFLSISYVALPPILGNKYPFILALQLLLLWALLTVPRQTLGLPPKLGVDHAGRASSANPTIPEVQPDSGLSPSRQF